MHVVYCVCCGQYRLERIVVDRLRGVGPQEWYRLRQYRPVVGDWFPLNTYAALDEAARALEKLGVRMWE